MRGKFRTRIFSMEYATGLLCIGALLIVLYFTALVSGRDILFRHKEYFYRAEFPNAGALAINDKVKILGVETGYVSHLGLAPDNSAVQVKISLRSEVKLPVDTEFTIQNSSVFGGAYINIKPGSSKKLATPETVFKGYPPVDIIAEASQLIAALKADEVKFRENFLNDEFIGQVKEAVKSIQLNTVFLNDICRDIRTGKGTIGKLFNDPMFYDSAQSSFARLALLLENLEKGKGTLGKLVQNDEVYHSLDATLKELRDVTRQIASGKSSLGKMAMDSGEIYTELRTAIDRANNILGSVESGKGSAGKILTSDEFYNELRDTVRQLRAAIEDFREMAPVATFGSIAFGAL